jgi:SAM-dependent methyltransferase
VDPLRAKEEIDNKMRFLTRFLKPEITFLEVGAGNCRLASRIAKAARKVFALEISEEIVKHVVPAKNLEIVISNGSNIPVPDGSIDVAYSYQVMEHIHPDDAVEQLRNVWQSLAPGGQYVCITPNRLSGPHDISQYFANVSMGLHLREYSWGELSKLMCCVGFSTVKCYVGVRNRYLMLPLRFLTFFERTIELLPGSIRGYVANMRLLRNLLFITAVGVK